MVIGVAALEIGSLELFHEQQGPSQLCTMTVRYRDTCGGENIGETLVGIVLLAQDRSL